MTLLQQRAADFAARHPGAQRNPYEISTWGTACGRGAAYKDMGPVVDGQKGAVRKISSGRKARGMSSDGLKL